MEKYSDEKSAISNAKERSMDSEDLFFVVLSRGFYYVDTDGFIRNWETLICTIHKGQIIT
ncbi:MULTISPECIES: hypothetical protein [unclassified Dysgonomonas]|uniref:hypothetical protein n=1 Tax=unclassified Dysgonomonas TaxID=2630389 RepID=UPI0024749264|nr:MULTISPECIES: hypothetical protein [unclassified Dysgonomonas]